MQNLGLPYNRDFNNGKQYGVGLMQYTIGDGKRCDTISSIIKPHVNKNVCFWIENQCFYYSINHDITATFDFSLFF